MKFNNAIALFGWQVTPMTTARIEETMNERKRMIARAYKRNRTLLLRTSINFDLSKAIDAIRAVGVSMRELATTVNELAKAMDWSEIAKRLRDSL